MKKLKSFLNWCWIRAIKNGETLRYPFSKKHYAIGLVEVEIAKIAEKKNLQIKSK